MSNGDDFNARLKRVEGRARYKNLDRSPPGMHHKARDEDFDAEGMMRSILRPQLALLLGAMALIAGRAMLIHGLGVEPSPDLLGWGEGLVTFCILVVIGLLFGSADHISHGALIVGAALAFVLEGYYIPLFPDLMSQIYTPEYVGLVSLGIQ